MKKIFIVTGANGFLGNNVIRTLLSKFSSKDIEVRAITHEGSTKVNSLEGLDCKIFPANVTKIETLEEAFKVPDNSDVYVIHCAAIVSIKAKKDPNIYNVNVNGTKNVINKVLEINAKLVYVNTVHSITEKPNNEVISEIEVFEPDKVKGAYAETKAEAANFVLDAVKNKGLNACIVHPSGMIGPNDFGMTHLTKLIQDLASGKFRVCVKGGYDFVDVRDVCDAIVNACEKGEKGNCYLLSNKVYTIKEVADFVCDYRKFKRIKFVIPMPICKFFAPVCELYYNIRKIPPLFTKLSLYTITSNGNFDNSKAKKVLGFNPRPITESITDTIEWLKEQNRIK